MGLISAAASIRALPVGNAIESVFGDDLPHHRTFLNTDGSTLDLSGAIMSGAAESYVASVTVGEGRAATLAVTGLTKIPAPVGNVPITSARASGSYVARIGPAAIPAAPNPPLDGARTLVSVVSVRAWWSNTRANITRFIVVWRRGFGTP